MAKSNTVKSSIAGDDNYHWPMRFRLFTLCERKKTPHNKHQMIMMHLCMVDRWNWSYKSNLQERTQSFQSLISLIMYIPRYTPKLYNKKKIKTTESFFFDYNKYGLHATSSLSTINSLWYHKHSNGLLPLPSCRTLKHSGSLHEGCSALQVLQAAEKLPRHRSLHRPELTPEGVV